MVYVFFPLVSADVRWEGLRDKPKERLRERLLAGVNFILNRKIGAKIKKKNNGKDLRTYLLVQFQ